MSDIEEVHAWLASSAAPASPAPPAPIPATPAIPTAPRDLVEEFIVKRNAEAGAVRNPLISAEQIAAQAAAGPPPAKTGDHVADYIARRNWEASRQPNPLKR
jgi:hypothetical protein